MLRWFKPSANSLLLSVLFFVLVWVSYQNASLWNSKSSMGEPEHREPDHGVSHQAQAEAEFDLAPILAANLIKPVPPKPQPKVQPKVRKKKKPKPVKRTKLVVRGTFINQGVPLALIAEKGKPARFYQPGDKLPGDSVLRAVHKDRIEFDTRREAYSLALHKPGATFTNVSAIPNLPKPKSLDGNAKNRPQMVAQKTQRQPTETRKQVRNIGVSQAARDRLQEARRQLLAGAHGS